MNGLSCFGFLELRVAAMPANAAAPAAKAHATVVVVAGKEREVMVREMPLGCFLG